MIAKCKAIAHGKTALEYIFREGKLQTRLYSNLLCTNSPEDIFEEMKLISTGNSRCRNRFLRIEVGIAPQDEKRLSTAQLRCLVVEFAERMGLKEHQWVAVTHKDTDNLHIHIIANRMDFEGRVYDTTFVSNKASRIAEELSRKYGLTIAKEVKAQRRYIKSQAKTEREQAKEQVRGIAYRLLEKHLLQRVSGYAMFRYELNQQGIKIEELKNKGGRTYGLRFHYEGYVFKASEVGREFGYHSLLKQFNLTVLSPYAERSTTPIYDPKQGQTTAQAPRLIEESIGLVEEVADTLTEGLFTPNTHGVDIAEIAFQRKLRHQANRKRGRRM